MADPQITTSKPLALHADYVWQRRWFQVLLAVLVIFLVLSYVVPTVLGALYAVRSVLVPVLLGLALAYVFNPLVTWAHRKLRLSRLASTLTLTLASLAVIAMLILIALPLVIVQGGQLIDSIQKEYPRYLDQMLERLDKLETEVVDPAAAAGGAAAEDQTVDSPIDVLKHTEELGDVGTEAATPEEAAEKFENPLVSDILNPGRNRRLIEILRERLQALDMTTVTGFATRSLDVGVGLVGSAVSITTYLVLGGVVAAFCFFFFSWKLVWIKEWFVPFIPASSRERTLDLLHQMDLAVSAFVRGRLIQSLVMIIGLSVGWMVVGVPYWFLLGIATGLMNLVPFLPAVGWLLALVFTVMTALTGGQPFTLWLLVWPTLVYFAVQLLDGWVVEPLVQGKATNLDPLTVLLVVLVGGAVAGLLGLLIAIPIAACIKILSREFILPRLREMASLN